MKEVLYIVEELYIYCVVAGILYIITNTILVLTMAKLISRIEKLLEEK